MSYLKDKKFTVAKGLEMQESHLQLWDRVLKPEVACKVRQLVNEKNIEMWNKPDHKTGYDVFRGDQITGIVVNLT